MLATAQFLTVFTVSVVNVAVPAIRTGLAVDASQLTWVVNSYVLAFGALLLLGGRLADAFGPRRIFRIGLMVLLAGSLASGGATSALMLIIARVVQGLGAALLAPAALSLVLVVFPPGPERSRAIAVWGAVSGAGGTVGVLLGGVLTGPLGWRSVFLVCVPIALVPLLAARPFLPADAPRAGRAPIDVAGAVLVTTALVAFTIGVVEVGSRGWSDPLVVGLITFAAVVMGAFLLVERRSASPLVPLSIFRNRFVTGANVVMLLLGATNTALLYFLPLYQQEVLGYTPLSSGLSQVPLVAAAALISLRAPRLARRFGSVPSMVVGLLSLAVGLGWLSRAGVESTFAASLLGPFLLIGIGLGVPAVLLTTAATTGLIPTEAGLASGLITATRQIGGAVGLALVATLAASRTAMQSSGVPPDQALNSGYDLAFLISAGMAAAASLLVLIVPRGGITSPPPSPAAPTKADP